MYSQWLLERLEEKGWSQAELARRMGVSRAAVSNVINSQRGVGFEFAVKAARALGVPEEEGLRAAGILSTKPSGSPVLDAINLALSKLPDDKQRDLVWYAEFLVQQQEQEDRRGKGKRSATANGGT